MFVSTKNLFAVPLVTYKHVYKISSIYDIGKLGFQNPRFSTNSREIYVYVIDALRSEKSENGGSICERTKIDTDFSDPRF